MRVISGGMGREIVHFEAPPSSQVSTEMQSFIDWFNQSLATIKNPVLRSAIAHLYFESIHPFEDGNGRIGRAISEKALAQGMGRPVLLSLYRTIEKDKKAYYEALKLAQRSNEITPWLAYFATMARDAQVQAEEEVRFTIRKTQFFDQLQDQLNERQLRVIKRMLAEGPQGFEGGMSAKKYMAIAKTSKATATRDLHDLSERGIFIVVGSGRSTRYQLEI
jgi:Fic family protein